MFIFLCNFRKYVVYDPHFLQTTAHWGPGEADCECPRSDLLNQSDADGHETNFI